MKGVNKNSIRKFHTISCNAHAMIYIPTLINFPLEMTNCKIAYRAKLLQTRSQRPKSKKLIETYSKLTRLSTVTSLCV